MNILILEKLQSNFQADNILNLYSPNENRINRNKCIILQLIVIAIISTADGNDLN